MKVRIDVRASFVDFYLLFGEYVGDNALGHAKVKISHRFHKSFVHVPRWNNFFGTLFPKRIVCWAETDGWLFNIGDVLEFDKRNVSEMTPKDEELLASILKKIEVWNATPGVKYGFF